jgi:hypothetical protein
MSEEPSTSGPSDAFLAAVGGLTVNWAVIETALDFCVAIIFHEFDGRNIAPEIPRSLSRKIIFLKKGMNHDTLSGPRAFALDLLNEIENEKERRHEVVHGAIAGPSGGDSVEMFRVKYDKFVHRTSMHVVTTAEVLAASDRAFALTDPAVNLGVILFGIARPEEPINDPGGDIVS